METPQIAPELDALIRARALIADEGDWCQCQMSRLVYLPDGSSRLQRCAAGAVFAAVGDDEVLRWKVINALIRVLPSQYHSLVALNDRGTHAEALALLDRAINEAAS